MARVNNTQQQTDVTTEDTKTKVSNGHIMPTATTSVNRRPPMLTIRDHAVTDRVSVPGDQPTEQHVHLTFQPCHTETLAPPREHRRRRRHHHCTRHQQAVCADVSVWAADWPRDHLDRHAGRNISR